MKTKRNRKPIDMTGYEFQTWKVIGLSQKKSSSNNQYWKCECQICHRIKDLCGTEIRLGRTGQCHHKDKKDTTKKLIYYKTNESLSNKIIDETGKRYGKLVVEKFAYIKNTTAYWLCNCDCGHQTIVRGNSLRTGAIQSCGCQTSRKEEEIVLILDNANIHYKREFKFADLKDVYCLRFDFAIFDEQNNLLGLIEYQGQQHYEQNNQFSNNGKLCLHDQMKKDYCLAKNIPLLELNKNNVLDNDILKWYLSISK